MSNRSSILEALAGQPKNLSGLLAYQKNSVVSKTIIQKKTGTVTLFAFDKSEGLSEHTVPFDALVVMLDGSADITISGIVKTVTRGESIILPADKPHSLQAVEQFKMLLIMIRS